MASTAMVQLRSFEQGMLSWMFDRRSMYLLLLSLASSTGCSLIYSGDLDKTQCKSQGDCDSAAARLGMLLVCREDVCQMRTCTQAKDCPTNSACTGNVCVARAPDAGPSVRTCTQDSDCESDDLRCGYDEVCYSKWGCLDDDPTWPAPPDTFSYSAQLRRAETPTDPAAVGSLTIDVCNSVDPNCTRPAVSPDEITLDSDANVKVPFKDVLSTGFTGFIRFRSGGTNASDMIVPAYRIFVSETPLSSDMVEPTPLNLLSPGTLSLLSAFFGIPIAEGSGIMQALILDCGGRPAPGMSITPQNAPDAVFFPLSSGGPVLGSMETTTDGAGTVANLPPEKQQVFVLRDESRNRVVSSTIGFYIHGAAMNYFTYFPRNSAVQKWLTEAKKPKTEAQ